MIRASELEEWLTVGQDVAVEQDSFGPALPRLTTDHFVLSIIPMTRVVEKRPVGNRHLSVILLDPAAHLPLQRRPQLGERRKTGLRIDVLGIEHRPNVGRQRFGMLEHLLPVVGPHPGIRIVQPHPVDDANRFAPIRRWGGLTAIEREKRLTVRHAGLSLGPGRASGPRR